ncbi:hypothetical protein IH980_00580 [Patescibacteria group bacterium]|nr:hypothetical protein [Patescibacteria group bacterium]
MEQSGRDWFKTITLLFLVITFTNVLVLDWVVGSSRGAVEVQQRLDAVEERVRRLSRELALFSSEEATVSVEPSSVAPTPGVPTPPPIVEKEIVVEKVVPQAPLPQVKEFYIPLGSTSLSTEKYSWKDTGLEAILDLSNYPRVSKVTFEATLAVPEGQVEARLYNVSDSYALFGSTLMGEGLQPKLHRSGNVALPSGNKTYRVQMRTSLNVTANMDNARIRILLE